jgi:adenylyltransferase/sulfurtransferase
MSSRPTTACVIGAGGLGCPALSALCAAGVQALWIVDHDVVESHNLQRQVLFSTADVGRPKVEAAAHRLRARRPELRVTTRRETLTPESVDAFVAALPAGTVLLECTDAPALKFAVNDAALRHGVPLVVGAALDWRGQALAVVAGHACYRCIYEAPPPAHAVPTCAEAGVLGAGVGLVGHLMAHLALRLGSAPDETAGVLSALDLLSGTVRTLHPEPRPGCAACGASAPRPARAAR